MGAGNLRINEARLWDSLMEMAQIGTTPKGGVKRLALSAEDMAGRALFARWCEAAGCTVRVDAAGNMFARREGRDPSRPPVLMGSHLDSQPTGGRFDGALGVLAGLEVLRVLQEAGVETEAPIELVNWTDEEGARFGRAMIGSGIWAGQLDAAEAKALRDAGGMTFGAALDAAGARGDAPARPFPADSYFELHIEQGPILERAGRRIGIVTGAQAQLWLRATVIGRDSHAGTTPPSARRDALAGAARMVLAVQRIMREAGEDGRGTVGALTVLPGSPNVIPGEVRFTVEFRNPSEAVVAAQAGRFRAEAEAIAAEERLELAIEERFRIPAQPFDPACVALVRDAAARLGLSAMEIVSGAGHDAVHVAAVVPSAMIFVPCRDGLSHNEAESIEPGEAADGAAVLLEAVLARAGRVG
ncbi:MAG: Zn-dependent hydrolase [Acetobacteraceae bacterium]|nr:Zn-dependent hydrolase [Acetobacteraceae bacterium]MDW8398601.1 Zn-dependent hydrolase [Acetobacteraceae bacterium]